MIHPLARQSLRGLSLPGPYATYRPGWTERIYTNPYGGDFRSYPCPRPVGLAARYAAWLEADLARRGQRAAVDPDRVMFTAGSIAGIELLIRAFCEPGVDSVGIQSPAFPAFAHHARLHGAAVVDVPLGGADLDRLDIDTIVASGAKLVFVCRPNNPVGSVPPFSQVLEIAARVAGLVVVDEAYMEFCDAPSAVALSDHPNVVVLRTFSKAWGLAGVRAGAVLAPPEVLDTLRMVADPFAFQVAAQQAVGRVLEDPIRALAPVDTIRHQRESLAEQLAALGIRVLPSETNFLLAFLPWVGPLPQSDAFVVPSVVPGALRIAIGTPDEDRVAFRLVSTLLETLSLR